MLINEWSCFGTRLQKLINTELDEEIRVTGLQLYSETDKKWS